jgi:hypothetical protein
MSNAYRILTSAHVIEVWVGRITKEEFFSHERQQWLDPKLPSAPQFLVDFTRATVEPSIGDQDIQEFVDLYHQYPDKAAGSRAAIVAGKEFDKASLYGRLAEREKVNVIVFTTIHTACVWLGVDEPEVRKWLERTYTELLGSSTPDV